MLRIALAVVLTAAPVVASEVTVDDLMGLRTIVDVEISPDGQSIACAVSKPSLTENQHDTRIYVVPRGGGAAVELRTGVRVFNSPMPVPRLRWKPDGSAISFLGASDGRPQVFAIAPTGGDARALTSAPEGVSGYEWSPDGASLAYVARDPMPADEEARRRDRSFVIEVGRPDRATRLWIRPLAGGEPRALTEPSHYVAAVSWSPDGRRIAYAGSTRSGFMGPYFSRLYVVDAGGGTPRAVVDRPGMNTQPQWSPDGRHLAFITTSGRVQIKASRGLAIVPAAGGEPKMLTGPGTWVGEFTWTPDGAAVYFVTTEGTFQSGARMFEQPIQRVEIATGLTGRIETGTPVNYSISLSRDGRAIAYRGVAARTMGDLFLREIDTGRTSKLTDVNPELASMPLGTLKPISWRSFDGMEIWGLLLTPPGWRDGQKTPLLVYCHGGPIGGVTYGVFPQFMHIPGQVDLYPTAAMASRGFAVLFPMPRGGSGYGEENYSAIVNAWGEGDYKDIMAGVDHLVAQGLADPERLGVMGASYGGFMTSWIVTQTGRFKAASTGASINDIADPYFLSEGGEFIAEYFGTPWEARDSFLAHSPLTHVARVTTPILIQHGENDPRVPIASAWKFYRALRVHGKTVEFEIYPRAGHVVYEPVLQREQMRRNLEWFLRWIKPDGAAQ
jgi:dipeptidyl aminopeptidase/acylaminoacyl peptidase